MILELTETNELAEAIKHTVHTHTIKLKQLK